MYILVVVPHVAGVKGGKLVWDGQEWIWKSDQDDQPIVLERGPQPPVIVVDDEPDYLEITRDIARGW